MFNVVDSYLHALNSSRMAHGEPMEPAGGRLWPAQRWVLENRWVLVRNSMVFLIAVGGIMLLRSQGLNQNKLADLGSKLRAA